MTDTTQHITQADEAIVPDNGQGDPVTIPDAELRKYIEVRQHPPGKFSSYQHKFLDKAQGVIKSVGVWKKTGAEVVQKLLFRIDAGWTEDGVKAWFDDHPEYRYPETLANGMFFALEAEAKPALEVESFAVTEAFTPASAPQQFDAVLIREGWGKNSRLGPDGRKYRDYITREFVQALPAVAEGSAVQLVKVREKAALSPVPTKIQEIAAELEQYGHPPETVNALYTLGLAGNTIGFLKNVQFYQDSASPEAGTRAVFCAADTPDAHHALALWQSALQHGLGHALGLSINYKATVAFTERAGQLACEHLRPTQHISTEFVTHPGAGGKLIPVTPEALAGTQGTSMEELNNTQATDMPPVAGAETQQAATATAQAGQWAGPVDMAALQAMVLTSVKQAFPQEAFTQLQTTIRQQADTIAAMQTAKVQQDLTGLVQAADVPQASKDVLLNDIATGKARSVDEVKAMLALVQSALTGVEKAAPVFPGLSRAMVGAEPTDLLKIRSLKMHGLPLTQAEQELDQKYHVQPFGGLKEEYQTLTGDSEMRMTFDPRVFTSRVHPELLKHRGFVQEDGSFTQSILTTTYTDFLTHIVNRTLELNFTAQDKAWEKMVQEGPAYSDNRDETHFILGQFGEVATVEEGASYGDLTVGGMERVTSSSVKRGGIFTISEETLQNDDLGYVQGAMQQIGYAANRTIYRAVMDKVIGYGTAFNNATMTDTLGGVLYAAARRNLINGSSDDYDKMRELISLMLTQVDMADESGDKAPLVLEPWLFLAETTKIGAVRARVKGQNEPGRTDQLPNTLYMQNIPDANFVGVHPTYLRDHPEALIVMPNPATHAGLMMRYFRGQRAPEMVWEGNQAPAYGQVFAADMLKLRLKFKYRLYYQRLSAFYGMYIG